jgi:hypothetical protein
MLFGHVCRRARQSVRACRLASRKRESGESAMDVMGLDSGMATSRESDSLRQRGGSAHSRALLRGVQGESIRGEDDKVGGGESRGCEELQRVSRRDEQPWSAGP